ncbi:hypothetical protein ACHAWU_009588 [Discostella pseudostelligera]|uniref:Uncharacterized protein n=1 Tax=Discostella pseudostelligera TaxID=259834 RepID=A0ABD3MA65_9STRA
MKFFSLFNGNAGPANHRGAAKPTFAAVTTSLGGHHDGRYAVSISISISVSVGGGNLSALW